MSAHNDEVSKWNLIDSISNIEFFKFNWMSKKFFIRLFLVQIVIAQCITLYFMIKAEKYDISYSLGMMGFVTALIGIYQYKK